MSFSKSWSCNRQHGLCNFTFLKTSRVQINSKLNSKPHDYLYYPIHWEVETQPFARCCGNQKYDYYIYQSNGSNCNTGTITVLLSVHNMIFLPGQCRGNRPKICYWQHMYANKTYRGVIWLNGNWNMFKTENGEMACTVHVSNNVTRYSLHVQ